MTDTTPPSQTPPTSPSDPTLTTAQGLTGAGVKKLPVRKRRRLGLKILGVLLLLLIVGGGLWTWIALTFSYASGEKQGYVQSLVRQGWLCKSWEGELAVSPLPGAGVAPGSFTFTIRDDSVATALQRSAGQLVALRYGEHRGVPSSCFGETQRFVTGFRIVP